jgi:hypothetical protein
MLPIISEPIEGDTVTVKMCDILRFETRGANFALVRVAADGTRSEIVLTPANVVHLGLLAPDFSRRLLADKIGKKSTALATFVKHRSVNTKLRIIEALLGTLAKSARLDSLMTERKARLLASRLIQKANELAIAPEPTNK